MESGKGFSTSKKTQKNGYGSLTKSQKQCNKKKKKILRFNGNGPNE
jgi:hypothetical protein